MCFLLVFVLDEESRGRICVFGCFNVAVRVLRGVVRGAGTDGFFAQWS